MSGKPDQEKAGPLMKWAMKEFILDISFKAELWSIWRVMRGLCF